MIRRIMMAVLTAAVLGMSGVGLAEPIDFSDMDLRFVDAAFDRGKKTYQILDSIVAAYDTKEQTGGSGQPLKPQSYAKGSAMETVAEYIYSPQL